MSPSLVNKASLSKSDPVSLYTEPLHSLPHSHPEVAAEVTVASHLDKSGDCFSVRILNSHVSLVKPQRAARASSTPERHTTSLPGCQHVSPAWSPGPFPASTVQASQGSVAASVGIGVSSVHESFLPGCPSSLVPSHADDCPLCSSSPRGCSFLLEPSGSASCGLRAEPRRRTAPGVLLLQRPTLPALLSRPGLSSVSLGSSG